MLKIIILTLNPVLDSKLKKWLDLRSQKINKIHKFNNTYWFHASSGEIEYCKSIIRLIKVRHPKAQVVVTYSSPSAEKLFHNITHYVDQFIPLCWDQPNSVIKLIDYIQPTVLIFSKTDMWPELITQIKIRRIKIGIISFNPQFNFTNNFLNRLLLPKLDFISCIEPETKIKLSNITDLRKVSVDGDTRFDQVFYRLSQESKLKISTDAKVLVCGSTWREDEDVLLESFTRLIKKNIKIILSPHEVDRENILRIQKELIRYNLSFQILSNEIDINQISFDKNIFIIDKIGYLADAYRKADIAFVGGSFKKKVHSVMEPLCCGLPVITGPHYQNNSEAVKYQKRYVFTCHTSEDVIYNIEKLILFSKDEILNAMKKNANASQKVFDLIQTRF